MFHWPLGLYCSYCADQLVTETSERKQNKTSRPSGRHTVYKCHLVVFLRLNVILSKILLIKHYSTSDVSQVARPEVEVGSALQALVVAEQQGNEDT